MNVEQDVQKTIYSIISRQLDIDTSRLNSSVDFRSLPNVSSMKVLQIILEVERAFDIELEDEVTFKVESLGQFESEVANLRERRMDEDVSSSDMKSSACS